MVTQNVVTLSMYVYVHLISRVALYSSQFVGTSSTPRTSLLPSSALHPSQSVLAPGSRKNSELMDLPLNISRVRCSKQYFEWECLKTLNLIDNHLVPDIAVSIHPIHLISGMYFLAFHPLNHPMPTQVVKCQMPDYQYG